MKIVYLCFDINKIAGGNRIILEHANRLAGRGHLVEIWSSVKPEKLPFHCEAPVYHFTDNQFPNSSDIAVITEEGFVPAIFQKTLAGKYFFLAQHDMELVAESVGYKEIQESIKKFFQTSPFKCEIISVSSWVQKRLQDKYHKNSFLIPNGIDIRLFHPTEPLLKTSEPSLIFCFDDQNWKGAIDALGAISIVKQRIKNCRVIIISAKFPRMGTFIDGKLEEITGFSWPVVYFHRPNQEDLAAIYSSGDVFFSSSWYEGFGLPGLEAMACGVPVVTTDSGGVREYAVPYETAVVVPPKNPEALAEGILRILSDKPLQEKLVRNGLEKVKKDFSWDPIIERLENLFLGESK